MLPWLEVQWQRVGAGLDRSPPGLMFVGPAGLGKIELAFATATAILCADAKDGIGCGVCDDCLAISKGLHPDLHLLTSEQYAGWLSESRAAMAARYFEPESSRTTRKPRQVITVDQVRALIENLSTHSNRGRARVALIVPASSLNINSANALLKILEEPPGDTRFLMVCSARDTVPATILSRVSVIECHAPQFAVGRRWLENNGVPSEQCVELLSLSSGAPLAALQLYRQGIADHGRRWRRDLLRLLNGSLLPVPLAASLGSEEVPLYLYWLERLLGDALSRRYGRDGDSLLLDDQAQDRELQNRLISRPLFDIIDKLQNYRTFQSRVIDERLFLEDVLVAVWQKG